MFAAYFSIYVTNIHNKTTFINKNKDAEKIHIFWYKMHTSLFL